METEKKGVKEEKGERGNLNHKKWKRKTTATPMANRTRSNVEERQEKKEK